MKELLFLAAGRARRWGPLLALLAVWAAPARAQISTVDPTLLNPTTTPADTATVRKLSKKQKRAQAAADSARRTERLFGFRVTRPEKAGFLAIIPGAGQVYNRKYWKLPIVYGVVGGLGYWVYYQQGYYRALKFANSVYLNAGVNNYTATDIANRILAADHEIPNDDLRARLAAAPAATISNGLVFARRYRDLAILLSALGYSLQILDAVVDAHLHDFDVSDNLSLNWQPTALPVAGQLVPAPGLLLTLRFK